MLRVRGKNDLLSPPQARQFDGPCSVLLEDAGPCLPDPTSLPSASDPSVHVAGSSRTRKDPQPILGPHPFPS